MASNNIVKCNGCNVVISEILAFIQNQVDVMTEDSITRLCVTAFSLEDVVAAKSLLYQSMKTSEKKIARKGRAEGRVQRDLEDIISLIKCTEAELMPIFVAKELRKLPPVTFDHIDVTRLLKDIIFLKDQLEVVRDQYATVDQVNQLRAELYTTRQVSMVSSPEHSKFVNTKRGASNPLAYRSIQVDSGPFGFLDVSQCPQKNITETSPEQVGVADVNHSSPNTGSALLPSHSNVGRHEESTCLSPVTANGGGNCTTRASMRVVAATAIATEKETTKYVRQASTTGEGSGCGDSSEMRTNVSYHAPNRVSYAQCAREGGEFINQRDDNWIQVQRRKLRNQFIGTKGMARDPVSKFKAADIRVPLFINNVDMQVSTKDITDYIMSKTQITVNLVEIKMKRQKGYKAYKVFVPRHKLSTFLDENLWPEGIAFRRFVDFGVMRFRGAELKESIST